MAGVVNFTFEHDPATLTDNVATQLNGVLDLDTPVAGQLTKHARAVRPGIPGVAHVEYRFILLLLGSVARVDGSPLSLGLPRPETPKSYASRMNLDEGRPYLRVL